jgi:hypothetical protein
LKISLPPDGDATAPAIAIASAIIASAIIASAIIASAIIASAIIASAVVTASVAGATVVAASPVALVVPLVPLLDFHQVRSRLAVLTVVDCRLCGQGGSGLGGREDEDGKQGHDGSGDNSAHGRYLKRLWLSVG